MKRLSKRGRDHELEPERADHVHPRRMRLVLAGGLSAIAMAAVVALGGGSFAVGAADDQVSPAAPQRSVDADPAGDQYGDKVTICVNGRERRVSRKSAERLVAQGKATMGPCP